MKLCLIACRPHGLLERSLDKFCFKESYNLVEGGYTRSDYSNKWNYCVNSLAMGRCACGIHDGVRPFVSEPVIESATMQL